MKIRIGNLVFVVAVLVLGAESAAAQTFTCNAAPAVTDGGYNGTLASMGCCTITAVDFGSGATVDDVDVIVALQNTYLGDLVIKVESPTGTVTTIQSRAGHNEPADDGTSCCGSSADWLGDFITYDDDGGFPSAESMGTSGPVICNGGGSGDGICAHTPDPGQGPGVALSDFDGENLVGVWQVCVGDAESGDPTTFIDASITLGAVPVELQKFTIE